MGKTRRWDDEDNSHRKDHRAKARRRDQRGSNRRRDMIELPEVDDLDVVPDRWRHVLELEQE